MKTNAERGQHQFQFITSHGLRRDDTFLDIGCGPAYGLRCGRLVIEYLNEDRYIGIDRLPMEDYELLHHPKRPTFIQDENFNFPDCEINFAWAQSVFTHLSQSKIKQCLLRLRPILTGPFFATFNLAGQDAKGELSGEGDEVFKSTRYTLKSMRSLAKQTNFRMKYLGDWGHWHGQKMLRFE